MRVVFIALVVVLATSGAAYAGGQITGNSIKDGTITTKDVKDHSLTRKDFKGSVRGPAGPQGIPGARGPAGPPGVTAVMAAVAPKQDLCAAADPLPDCAINLSEAKCPKGMIVTGGGYSFVENPVIFGHALLSSPNDTGTGWIVVMVNDTDADADFVAIAECVRGSYAGVADGGVSKAEALRKARAAVG